MTIYHAKRTVALMIICTAMAGGCRTPRELTVARCIKEQQQDLMIRWGTKNDSTSEATYYELDARGALFVCEVEETDTTKNELQPVEHARYCTMADLVTRTFVKVQALHSPGTKARFIEYTNPSGNVFLRAVWNPDLSTFQSRDMRALYDSLITLTRNG